MADLHSSTLGTLLVVSAIRSLSAVLLLAALNETMPSWVVTVTWWPLRHILSSEERAASTWHCSAMLFSRLTDSADVLKSSWATTIATCSSLASLAVAFEVAEDRLKLPQRIYSFTLPLGAQLNKDGTSIMLAGVLLFTAQAAGVDFSLASQISIILIGLVLSEGSGGIPGGGLVIALIFVQAFSLPLEIAAIVAGIYRLIDMGSTTINVMGDMVGTAIVSHSERHSAEASA